MVLEYRDRRKGAEKGKRIQQEIEIKRKEGACACVVVAVATDE